MNDRFLLDTDVLIDYLRGVSQSVTFLEEVIKNSVIYLSAITVAELYAGVREGREKQLLEKFLQYVECISVDYKVAQMGGLYRRDYGKSNGLGLADAIIGATADYCNAKLVTLNQKHFPMLTNIMVPYTKK